MTLTRVKIAIKRRILPILLIELVLAIVFSYAIVQKASAYNQQKKFDASKINFAVTNVLKPTKALAASTVKTIQENQDAALTNASTVHYAMKYLGYPYVLGGRNIETGLDCAGFVNYVFTKGPAGKNWKSMNVPGLYHEIGGKSVSTKNMQPGDIIFFGSGLSHVAIYAGNGKIVHAMDESHGICTTTLFRSNGSTYSGKKIVDVRRVL